MPFTCEEDGEYILLAPESNSAPDKWDPGLESLTVDGKSFRIPDDLDPYFIGKTGSRNGLFLMLFPAIPQFYQGFPAKKTFCQTAQTRKLYIDVLNSFLSTSYI